MKGTPGDMFNSASGDGQRGDDSGKPDKGAEAAHRSELRMPDGEVLRPFDLSKEDPSRLVALKEAVYARPIDRAAFDWEYLRHPRATEIRVYVVEQEGRLVASTTRLPATLILRGQDCPAFFNIDSMVDPSHRRRGRMRDLYRFARAHLRGSPIFVSKGSSSQIYPLLLSVGHREIVPNTYLVSYPSAARWLMARLHLRAPSAPAGPVTPAGFEDHRPVERFGPSFDAFFQRVAPAYPALFRRDAAYMNWRYVDIPHKRYVSFQREVDGAVASVVVLSLGGQQGQIVDLVWDPARPDEPERTIRFAQAFFDEHEAVRVACFATHPRLRELLVRSGFLDRGETPRFSALVPAPLEASFDAAASLHVTEGDGDTEFS